VDATIRNVRKLGGEEGLKGILELCGVPHHAHFIRVREDEQTQLQEPVEDPCDRFGDLQRAHEGQYRTVQVPGFDGEYVVHVVPFAE
jgi:hypothetical protein